MQERNNKAEGWYEGRKALVSTLIAIALNPISAISGYYLSKYLASPHLKVEYVIAHPLLKPSTLPLQLNRNFTRDPVMMRLMESKFPPGHQCLRWTITGEVPPDCLDQNIATLSQFFEGIKSDSEVLKKNIDTLNGWTRNSELALRSPIYFRILESQVVHAAARRDKLEALDLLRTALYEYNQRSLDIGNLLAEFERMKRSAAKVRTGGVTIAVGGFE